MVLNFGRRKTAAKLAEKSLPDELQSCMRTMARMNSKAASFGVSSNVTDGSREKVQAVTEQFAGDKLVLEQLERATPSIVNRIINAIAEITIGFTSALRNPRELSKASPHNIDFDVKPPQIDQKARIIFERNAAFDKQPVALPQQDQQPEQTPNADMGSRNR